MTSTGLMTGLSLPAPFISAFREAMERLADGPLAPALDLFSTPEEIVAHVALPGVRPKDVDVTIADDLVTISGSVNDEGETFGAGYLHKELSRGKVSRSFWLPAAVNAEGARASFKDGLLMLTLPKAEEARRTNVRVDLV